MANIENLILFLVLAGVVSYFATQRSTMLGSIITIFSVMFAFASLAFYGLDMQMDTTVSFLNGFTFEQTYLGLFFTLIITFIYLMVSFFHPSYLSMYRFKNTYNLLFLISLAGVFGAFYTSNFIQLFFFFELVIWTTMFLIPQGKSQDAAVSYFGFSMAGSVAMLVGIFMIYAQTNTLDIQAGLAGISGATAGGVFVLFLVAAFAKLGSFPLHIWLPIAHGNAPHPFSPVLSGALVKLGAFIGILSLVRIAPVTASIEAIGLPIAQLLVAGFGAISIVFGTLMAIKENDAKKLLAYSSMSHGGYILVAFSVLDGLAFAGGFYHILAHAIASASAFMAIAVVAKATGTTKMDELGGMIHKMPITYIAYLVAIISMAGIPPMGGFISKWMIFQSVINHGMILIAVATFFGSVGSFLYVFRPLAALFLGQSFQEHENLKEAPVMILIPTIILIIANVFTGVYPAPFLNIINYIISELGYTPIEMTTFTINGVNGILNPALISGVFVVGVVVAAILFFSLKKSRKVGLMDTYTAGNFVHDEHLLHYSVDFFAPVERLYEKYTHGMTAFYKNLAYKVKELGLAGKYLFMGKNLEATVFWIVAIIMLVLWGEIR